MNAFVDYSGKGDSVFSCKRGLSLLEVLLALTILLLAIPGIYMLFTFTSSAFTTGQARMDVQQNLRLVADYIVEETRYSDEISLIDASEVNSRLSEGYDYLWVSGDGILHHNQESRFETISDRVNLSLLFSFDHERDNTLLDLVITGQRDDGTTVDYDTEVRLLNMSVSSADTGVAIEYLKPAPPPIVLDSLQFYSNDPDHPTTEEDPIRGHHFDPDVAGDTNTTISVYVLLKTRYTPDGTSAEINEVVGPREYDHTDTENVNIHPYQVPSVESNRAVMKFAFNGDEPSGSYEVRSQAGFNEGWVASISSLYRIFPVFESIVISTENDDYPIAEHELRNGAVYSWPSSERGLPKSLKLRVFDPDETVEARMGSDETLTPYEPSEAAGVEYIIPTEDPEDLLVVIRLNSSDDTVFTDYSIRFESLDESS